MMEIKSPLHLPERAKSETGSPFMTTYTMCLDKDGHKYLKETGKTNVYLRIQESLESTKIENIIARFMNGDINAINQRHGEYIDATNMPKSLAEAQNTILRMYQEFEELPLAVKQAFNNAPEQWVAQYGTEEFMNKISPFLQKTNDGEADRSEEKGENE